MRLNRLDLTRYGRFSDAQIDLPAPTGGTADVTVIYGPNEAGKSTAFTAFLELLYGMKPRDHPYDFRFKRSDLLVGGEIDLPNRGPVVLQRNSKRAQSLLDDQGRPVDETLLTAALHGLGRDDYVERFSLDDEGLRTGGARIASAKGDLGQLLHAGVSGLTSMAGTLDEMAARADKFHKKGGRGTALKLGKDRLTEIGRDLRETRLTPDRDRELGAAVAKALTAFELADADLITARLREAASKAAQIWYDTSKEISALDGALASYPDGPDLRKGAAEQIARLVASTTEKTNRIAEADDNIAAHAAVIADNPPDPAADALAAELAQLDQLTFDGAPLMARATTARSDLGNRISDRDGLRHQIDQTLARLSCSDVPMSSLAIAAHQLEDLAQAAQAVVTAQTAVSSTANAVTSAKKQQGAAPPEPQDLSPLQAAWDRWQTVADLTVQQNAVAVETGRLATAVAGLPTTWSALVDAGLPARETLLEHTQDMLAVTTKRDSAQAELDARDVEYRLAQSRRLADEAGSSAIDAAMTAQARRLRDTAWQTHRATLSVPSANDFEAAMHNDDDAQASFNAGADARGQLATAHRDENAAQVLRDKAQDRLERLNQDRDTLIAQSARLAGSLGLAHDTPAAAFSDRHAALDHAAKSATQLANAKADLETLSDRRSSVCMDLTAAAKLVGIACSKSDLPGHVHAALTLQDSVRQTWAKWDSANQSITELEEIAAQAAADNETADSALTALTATLPVAGRTAQDLIAALPDLRSLQRLHSDHEKISGRIEALKRADAQLCASAVRINTIAPDDDDPNSNPLAVIDQARSRVACANSASLRRGSAQVLHSREVITKRTASDAIQRAQSDLQACFQDQGAQDLLPPARIALLTERDALRADRKRLDAVRTVARTGAKTALFDTELAMLPDAARAAGVQQLLDDAQEIRDRARDAHREAERLYQEAYDASDRSELATEQATLLEELRDGARRAAVARLGVLAAKGALRRLATERRTTMLRDVEKAFVAITDPAWASVDVWSQAEGEKLVGVQPDGSVVPVDMMSTGTMGQLYFALRVAGYRSFARDLGPLPMILDDIMETFDDGRAKASLQLCADIGTSGQAILFTHHAHLVDLARATIDGVTIVDMPS